MFVQVCWWKVQAFDGAAVHQVHLICICALLLLVVFGNRIRSEDEALQVATITARQPHIEPKAHIYPQTPRHACRAEIHTILQQLDFFMRERMVNQDS